MSCIHPPAQFLPGVWSKLFPFVFPLRSSSVAVLLCLLLCTFFFFFDMWVKNEMDTWCGIEMSEHNGVCILITHPRRGLANQPWMDLCGMSVSPSEQSSNHEISSVDCAVFHLFSNNLNSLKALSSLQIALMAKGYLLRSSLAFHLFSSVSLRSVLNSDGSFRLAEQDLFEAIISECSFYVFYLKVIHGT